MECVTLGWMGEDTSLRLDYRTFSYAGKFVVGTTGKAVIRASNATDPATLELPALPSGIDPEAFDRTVLAAIAFNEDRTDATRLWLRYVTVRRDRRGEGLGPTLVAHVVSEAADREYGRVAIAVNNPFAYVALHKAGFGFTGRETGLAELVLERPSDAPARVDRDRYQRGLDIYRRREAVTRRERAFLDRHTDRDPPPITANPKK
ncbi:MAG: GNAT family N-acetyltransferase [Halobacteriota archaeon]